MCIRDSSNSSTEKTGASPIRTASEDLVSSSSKPNMSSDLVQSESKMASSRSMDDAMSQKRVWIFPGGYRSSESYIYVRGRGRGRYVCATCGVRCKKPSVLRKHLRSHTDVRPHHCHVCDVGFKTKGNLSKHLNSKAHHLRSTELGSSGEQPESAKSVEGSSYDADLDSSCELAHGSSTVDPESDSGCELQPGSSCEVEMEVVSVPRQSSSVDTGGESQAVDKCQLVSGAETSMQTDSNMSSKTRPRIAYSQSLSVDVSAHTQQPLAIATALQQKQSLQSKLKLAHMIVILYVLLSFNISVSTVTEG